MASVRAGGGSNNAALMAMLGTRLPEKKWWQFWK
jgi:hypothetical protein